MGWYNKLLYAEGGTVLVQVRSRAVTRTLIRILGKHGFNSFYS